MNIIVCVCAQVHVKMCQETGAQLDNERLCEHLTELVVTSREPKVTIYFIQTNSLHSF